MPGGDRMLLEDLARLDDPPRPTVHGAPSAGDDAEAMPRAREARMPDFAVLVDPDEQDARTLVALRPTFEPAVAFVTDGVKGRIIDALEHADWRVVRVRRTAEIGGAWSGTAATARARVVPERGRDSPTLRRGGAGCTLIPSLSREHNGCVAARRSCSS